MAAIRIFHLFQLPDFVDLELGVLSIMVNDAYFWIIPYSQHCFLWKFVFYSRKAYLAHQYKKMLYHPYSYRITIDENPNSLQRICVLSYFSLLLTKVQFETSFKSFQYNTEGRRLSNYPIKLILCSHYRSRCKGLCQNKKHEFDQYTKGGHFCAAHMALIWVKSHYSHQSNIFSLETGRTLSERLTERLIQKFLFDSIVHSVSAHTSL